MQQTVPSRISSTHICSLLFSLRDLSTLPHARDKFMLSVAIGNEGFVQDLLLDLCRDSEMVARNSLESGVTDGLY
jgi:hypothetical protein